MPRETAAPAAPSASGAAGKDEVIRRIPLTGREHTALGATLARNGHTLLARSEPT